MGFWSDLFGGGFKRDEVVAVSSDISKTPPIDPPLEPGFTVKYNPSPSEVLKMRKMFDYYYDRFSCSGWYIFESSLYEVFTDIRCGYGRDDLTKILRIKCPTFDHTLSMNDADILINDKNLPGVVQGLLETIENAVKTGVIKLTPTPFGKLVDFGIYGKEVERSTVYMSNNVAIELDPGKAVNIEKIKIFKLIKDLDYDEMVVAKVFDGSTFPDSRNGRYKLFYESAESINKVSTEILEHLSEGENHIDKWEKIDSIESHWVEEMAATRSIERSKRHKQLVNHMSKVFELHEKFNSSALKYEHMPATPIKCYASYVSFMKEINLIKDTGLPFKDYEVENYLRNIGKYEKN